MTRDDAIRKLMMKHAQLIEYRDTKCQGDDEVTRHSFAIANARISQLELDLAIVTKIST